MRTIRFATACSRFTVQTLYRVSAASLLLLLGACVDGQFPTEYQWCTPTTCEQAGKNCGVISDGCNATLDCGTCSGAETCGGGGVGNVCGTGTCTPTTCAAQGKNCGIISDGCDATLNCGSCSGSDTCGGGGTANVCGAPAAPLPTCSDGIQNGNETGVDCGGSCSACAPTPSCFDGIRNGNETGVDCGGSCSACAPTASCSDGIKNGNETGVDCGGSCSACAPTASCSDGIKNGNETGVDCGGSCSACATSSCTPATYEAETMYHSTGGTETGGWNIWANGYVSTDATFAGGTTTVTVVAYGEPSSNVWPHMVVSVDGTSIGDTTVSSSSWAAYEFTATVTAGTHELRVAFDNDACCKNGDRNLYVDSVVVGCSGGSSSSTPSCSDGIRNGNETGVDCGGSCAACPTTASCSDGIRNGNETGVDCGGSCAACPTTASCSDGIRNGNETGIDCGGSCAACSTGGGSGGGLYVSGNQIFDANGQAVQIHGVNRSGSEYACVQGWDFFDGPTDDASLQAIADWNANAVRVPLNEDCWLNINGIPSAYAGSNYQQAIAAFVDRIAAHGMYAIVELHWTAPGSQRADGQNPMPDRDHSVTFWSQVANYFKNNDMVIFEPFNEPYPDGNSDTNEAWRCWRDGGTCSGMSYQAAGMQELVTAIRNTGATNLILLGGVQYSNGLSQFLSHMPTDPLGNLAAAWHVYNFNLCSNTSCYNDRAGPVAAAVPLVATEIGEDDCGGGFINTLMSWLDGRNQSYLAWTWDTWGNCLDLISNYSGSPAGTYGRTYHDHIMSRP